MVSHIWPRVRGSRPVVGSSRKISGGREIRLAARSSRRRMPPENCEICLSPASSRPNRPSRSSAVDAGLLLVDAEQPAEQVEVLAGGEVLVDRGVLAGHADQLAHHVRVLLDVDAEDLGAAAVHRAAGSRASGASWSCRRRWARGRRRPRRGGPPGRCRRRPAGRRRSSRGRGRRPPARSWGRSSCSWPQLCGSRVSARLHTGFTAPAGFTRLPRWTPSGGRAGNRISRRLGWSGWLADRCRVATAGQQSRTAPLTPPTSRPEVDAGVDGVLVDRVELVLAERPGCRARRGCRRAARRCWRRSAPR